MLYPIATLALLPFLLVQGRRVRRNTPRLPEPAGDRCGEAGQGRLLRLLIVGDSAAAGVGAEHQSYALSGQLVAELAGTFRVQWTLLAATGRTSTDVLNVLATADATPFDVALVSVGVNDVTGGTGSRSWRANTQLLASRLQSRFGVRHVLLTSVPPMDQFPALPQPLRWYLGERARQLNGWLQQLCQSDARSHYLEVPFPFEAAMMASDGFHPGVRAYALWGRHSAERIIALHQDVPC